MTPRVFSVSDQAITLELATHITENTHHTIQALALRLSRMSIPGVTDIVPAYCSLTVFYDIIAVRKTFPGYATAFEALKGILYTAMADLEENTLLAEYRTISIPICYSPAFGWDMEEVCQYTRLSVQEIIRLHTLPTYRVYMMGFLPGFAYLGGLDTRLVIPRKSKPRSQVPIGSVGLGGSQTGIYPLRSPGGWQLIGRTPVLLFDKHAENPVLLRTGDSVTFFAIDEYEFYQLYREPTHS